MTIATRSWSPFQQMERMQQDLDRLVGSLSESGQRRASLPAVDVEQTADAMILKLDLPGIDRDKIAIETHDGTLIISGEREEERNERHEGYVVRERSSGSFARSFTLPPRAKVDEITASIEGGVLEVTVPRPTDEQPTRIPVR